ncbi:2',3'-cyclic-nucleotide 2'-phosphodiesterase / 3'-nucleotidase / 5'-nucleotidase [Salimicrobium halophilum]|uniref:2',3'-cyclic-nucleotide 2'-phosphodiesterase / 3'-nucleotidase / 5'-nucleotidase n=1 Tax=Salimicrobium halophilum TaxID=86666 RepID=A0A1G8S3Z2_9BACI|nr:5'-nucleotidase C-terminal domain-containing protein [Salimicrobium halophilum]SDJ23505.1 2',3'-cyclic-nucleotide 2'-phosphodiesterase / 3'-nucleotidase / 5'-nucleotidase [Salimicrobium halophilum]
MSKNKKMLTASAIAATAAVTVSAPAVMADSHQFEDVNDRYTEAVDFLVEQGATQGYTETTFGTYMPIKRVDAAVQLANVLGLDIDADADTGFNDVPARAEAEVAALKEAGITEGKTSDTFGANDLITRGELAIWIQEGFGLEPTTDTIDFDDVSNRYYKAVQALVDHGITNGVSETEFGVDMEAKRGDYAVFLHRAAEATDDDYELALMHTNDTHGNIGNIAETKTAVDNFRGKNPASLLLSGGDVFSGTLYFQEFLGQADLDFMNQLGYDAMSFGNHEFDLGAGENGHEALAEFVNNAEFPFVASNVDFSEDPLFDDMDKTDIVTADAKDGQIYSGFTKKVKGEEVGIFGLTTEETADISSPENITFSDYIEEAEAMVQAFEDRGVDKVIALTHLGLNDNPEYDNDEVLAEEVDGIDIIVGGHTHTEIPEPRFVDKDEPTVIVQAGGNNDNLGTLEVEFDSNGVITDYEGELVELDGLPKDESFAEQLEPYTEQVQELQEEEIGVSAEVPLNGVREDVRTGETNLGNLITDGMLWKAQQINPETQIAVSNGGGIRTSIDEGPITLGEILEVMPFGNELGIMEIQGSEFMEALEHSVSTAPTAGGQFLHVAGMKFEYDSSQPAGERIVSAEVLQDDGTYEPLMEDEMYYVASNLFTIQGGDDYDMFAEVYEDNRVSEPGFVDYDVFTEYLQTQGDSVSPEVEGRIVDVNQ